MSRPEALIQKHGTTIFINGLDEPIEIKEEDDEDEDPNLIRQLHDFTPSTDDELCSNSNDDETDFEKYFD
jgi:hypothetical protein